MGTDFIKNNKYKNLLIVDGLNLAFRYKYANKKDYAPLYVKTIQSLAKSYDAKKVIVLGDGGSSYRENIYPDYKGNRKELRAQQTQQEADDFQDFLDEFNIAFELLGMQYETFRFKGVEADDIAAYLVKYHKNEYEHTWLISSDKDWDLLIADNVSRFAYTSRKEITLDTWEDFYNYTPEQHISIKVLMGDKGDNVPGVEGIGEKRANTILRDYETAYDVYSNLPIDSKYKYMQNLNGFGDQILLNYELMDLLTYCEDAIGEENIDTIEEKLNGN
jgi:5'-3' exonuclease